MPFNENRFHELLTLAKTIAFLTKVFKFGVGATPSGLVDPRLNADVPKVRLPQFVARISLTAS